MYTVIGATKTRTLRVMWLLEELGADYDQEPAMCWARYPRWSTTVTR